MSLEIERIKELCMHYERHLTDQKKYLSYFEQVKRDLTEELLKNADNPKKLLNLLEEPSNFLDSPSKTKADILRTNRNSPLSWFFKGVLLLITAPVSLPLLMLWSFKTRGTINFFKADGAIFLERLIPLCQCWTEPPSSDSSSGKKPSAPTIPISKGLSPMKYPTLFSLTPAAQQCEMQPSEEAIEDVDLKNMSRFAGQVANIFDPEFTMGQMLKDFKGQAMIIASDPIEKTDNPNELRLRFTCELMYTAAPHEICEIRLFKTFSPMVVEKAPAPLAITGPTNIERQPIQYPWIQTGQEYCLSFFKDNFASMMKKGHENVGHEDGYDLFKRIKYYEQALTLAKTDVEKLWAIEFIINSADACRAFFRYGPFLWHESKIQEKIKAALEQLPPDYRRLSVEITKTNALYQTIWTYLETNETKEAWKLFQTITLSHFIIKACPELDAMRCQLAAVFEINGEDEQLEDGAISAVGWLHEAYRRLSQQNYSLCIMTAYDPLRGAEPGKLFLQESKRGPLHYVIRNGDDTADFVGMITQEELAITGVLLWDCPGPKHFILNLERQISRLIAILVDRGHAQQSSTLEAPLMREYAIKAMGQIQLHAAEAWEKTPPYEVRARAHALDQRKTAQVWNGQRPQIRIDKEPKYFPKDSLKTGQWAGSIDPSIRYLDDTETTSSPF